MKKKQLLSSLMISGILLSNIAQASAATQVESTGRESSTTSSIQNNQVTNPNLPSNVSASTSSTAPSAQPDATASTVPNTNLDSDSDSKTLFEHVTGARAADSSNIWGLPLDLDNINVNSIKETRSSQGEYITDIDGSITPGLIDRGGLVELFDDAGNLITSKTYNPGFIISQEIGSVETSTPVAKVRITSSTAIMGIEAVYILTDAERPTSNEKPTINATDKTLSVGDAFDLKAGVTANDTEDGDLTSKVVVKSSDVDTSKAGTYSVTYSVTDSDGNTTEKTITVTVNNVAGNHKPVINASNKTLTVGDSFDLMAGVTATDAEDGNLTSEITVKSSNVDTSKAGSYYITYSVTDSDGNTTEKTITVTVENAAENHKPVINASDKTLTVGDHFDLKAGVTASDEEDGDLTENISIISSNVDTSKAGTYNVTYSVTDSDGNTTEKTITVTVKAATVTDGTVTPDEFDMTSDRSVKGTYTGDVASVRLEINGVLQAVGGTVSDGKFSYYVGGKIASATDNVWVIGYDSTGKELDREKVTIKNAATQGTVNPDDFDLLGKRSVTGTYTGDVASVRLEINGALQAVGGTVSDGKFSYYVGGKITSATDDVWVIGYDSTGKELDREKVTIKNASTQGTVTPDEFDMASDHSVTGTYTGDVASVRLEINGVLQAVGGTVSDGKFSYYVGGKIASATGEVWVIGYDSTGKELDREKVTIKDSAAQGTVTPNEFDMASDNSVTGTYTGDVASVRLEINQKLQAVGGTVSDGKFSYYVRGKVASVTDEVYVIGYDSTGKELDRKKVTIANSAISSEMTPNDFEISHDRKVTGSYEGNITSVRVEVNGELLGAGGTASEGNFEYYVGGKIASTNDTVYVHGYDKNGNELVKHSVTIKP